GLADGVGVGGAEAGGVGVGVAETGVVLGARDGSLGTTGGGCRWDGSTGGTGESVTVRDGVVGEAVGDGPGDGPGALYRLARATPPANSRTNRMVAATGITRRRQGPPVSVLSGLTRSGGRAPDGGNRDLAA